MFKHFFLEVDELYLAPEVDEPVPVGRGQCLSAVRLALEIVVRVMWRSKSKKLSKLASKS